MGIEYYLNNELMVMLSKLSVRAIWVIILLEGFVTISFEILTMRQLIPVMGNSIIVTSLIIGVFLLFLAYGYRAGGLLQANFCSRLQRNFFSAALGIGIGVSYLFINLFFELLQQTLGIPTLAVLVCYLLLITAPIVYLLGQTVPITMSLLHKQQTVGELSGKVLHLSTIGSFLGSVLTTLLLLNFWGVAWTVFLNVLALALLFCLVAELYKRNILLWLLPIALGLSYAVNCGVERLTFIKTTPYANYSVNQDPVAKAKYLAINESASSSINELLTGFPYIEYIKSILFEDLNIHDKNILVLGAGGFTLSAAQTFGNHFTYVDIDPAIYQVVKQHFLENIQGKFVAADARQFVREHPHSYDVIVSDTYSNSQTIPPHLLTQEYFADLKRALKPNGIAVFNIIGSPLLNTTYTKRVDNTIRSVFSSCTMNPLVHSWQQEQNLIYICQINNEASDNMIYTDDRNEVSVDYFKAKKLQKEGR